MNLPQQRATILDAGVGASLLPAFLSSLGHSVVAADLWDKENKSIEGNLEFAERSYSFNTVVQRLILPAIESGFSIIPAQGMADDGKLVVKRNPA